MPARAIEQLLTADEFARLPEPEGGSRMELVEGKVVMTPPPGAQPGKRTNRISSRLTAFVEAHALGEVLPEIGFRLQRDADVVRAPDSSFVAAARVPDSGLPDGYIDGAPDLAVEVVSPHDSAREILEKVGGYLDAGAARVWVVRPATRTVTVYNSGGEATTLRSGATLTSAHAGFAIEGFALTIDELFA